jgi:hypothetical protein
MNRIFLIIATVAFSWIAVVPTHAGKCEAAKLKCTSKKVAGLLKCHAKAEKNGTVVDPICTLKVTSKFDNPTKGCIAKAEAKGGCAVASGAATLETTIDTFVSTDIVPALDPFFPGPIPDGNLCSSKKKSCVAKKVKGLLKCYAKAEKKGLAVDPVCLAKAMAKFDGGSSPAKGCFAKLEAKGGCLTISDTAAIEAIVDAFVEDSVIQIVTPTTTTTTTSSTTTTTTMLCDVGGLEFEGACWYLGVSDESCATVCANQALFCDSATSDAIAGQGGTSQNCLDVLSALGAGLTMTSVFGNCAPVGCSATSDGFINLLPNRCANAPDNCTDANGLAQRACVCSSAAPSTTSTTTTTTSTTTTTTLPPTSTTTTTTLPTCADAGGRDIFGACWFLGAMGESCSTVCANQGLPCDSATSDAIVGQGGTNDNCFDVLFVLNATLDVSTVSESCPVAGCAETNVFGVHTPTRCTALPDSCVSATGGARRACVCSGGL